MLASMRRDGERKRTTNSLRFSSQLSFSEIAMASFQYVFLEKKENLSRRIWYSSDRQDVATRLRLLHTGLKMSKHFIE
jgi:hypothetical protein